MAPPTSPEPGQLSALLADLARVPEAAALLRDRGFAGRCLLAGDGEPAGLVYLKALATFGKPLLAAVEGVAVGIGTTSPGATSMIFSITTSFQRFAVGLFG